MGAFAAIADGRGSALKAGMPCTPLALAAWMLAAAPQPVAAARSSLEQVSKRRIFFGHQSVGANILEGLSEMSGDAGQALPMVEGSSAALLERPAFAHALVGRNEDPESKIAQFRSLLLAGIGERAEIAFFKFCYIDFKPTTDVEALFARYRAAMDELRARFPNTHFVHVTAPLTTVQRGARAWLKNHFGSGAFGERENVKREQYNALLRATFEGREPLFDLAKLESTSEAGEVETFERDGRAWTALSPSYTDDGGHLNAAGRRRVAKALAELLARLPFVEAHNR